MGQLIYVDLILVLFLFNIYLSIYVFYCSDFLADSTWNLHCSHAGSLTAAHRLSSCGMGSVVGLGHAPSQLWDLSSPTRDGTHVPVNGQQDLTEVPMTSFFNDRI